jgi:hypothetical protein
VQIFPIATYSGLIGGTYGSESPLGHEKNLILLLQFLSRVSDDPASGDALNNLLRIVHKYPLLEHNYDQSDGLSSLRKQVITATEKYLGAYSQVSVRFYTMRISLIQIPHFRYAMQPRANMKKQHRSTHRHQPMSMNLFELRLSNSRVALNKLSSIS